jgi:hypothetical protein
MATRDRGVSEPHEVREARRFVEACKRERTIARVLCGEDSEEFAQAQRDVELAEEVLNEKQLTNTRGWRRMQDEVLYDRPPDSYDENRTHPELAYAYMKLRDRAREAGLIA